MKRFTNNRAYIITLCIFLLFAVGIFYVNYNYTSPTSNSKQSVYLHSEQSYVVKPNLYHVALLKNKAEPTDLLIHMGDFVEFDSKDGLTHEIVSGEGTTTITHTHADQGVDSGPFKAYEAYRAQFNAIGIFPFIDKFNPHIQVFISVYNASTTK